MYDRHLEAPDCTPDDCAYCDDDGLDDNGRKCRECGGFADDDDGDHRYHMILDGKEER